MFCHRLSPLSLENELCHVWLPSTWFHQIWTATDLLEVLIISLVPRPSSELGNLTLYLSIQRKDSDPAPSANRTGLVQFYLCMSWGLLTSVFQFVGQAKKVQNTTQNYVLRGHWSAAPVVATVEFISSPLFEVCETKKQRRGLNPVFFTQCPGEWVRFFFRFKKASQGKFDQARFYLKACVPLSKIAPEMNKYLYGFGHLDTFLCISKSISLFSDTGLSGSSVRTRRF